MSLFLGHSRKAHDHYYKMKIGHECLTEAFNNLETFETFPDAKPSRYVTSKYPTSNISPAKVYSSDICEDLSSLNQTICSEQTDESLFIQPHSPYTSFQILPDSLTSDCLNPHSFQNRLQSESSAENLQTGEYYMSIILGRPNQWTLNLSNSLVSDLNSSTFQDNSSQIKSLITTVQSSESCISLSETTKSPLLSSDTSLGSNSESSNSIITFLILINPRVNCEINFIFLHPVPQILLDHS